MKLILSRKGFDSASGGTPSAILPDGRLCWFPIPSTHAKVRYKDLRFGPPRIADLISDLSKERVSRADRCHLDPDIMPSHLSRPRRWRPCFGQIGISQSHLLRQGVTRGDLFLFFGWFRRIEESGDGHWDYVSGAPDLHVIFGWLHVGGVFEVSRDLKSIPAGCRSHVHVIDHAWYDDPPSNNTIYVANKKLEFPGIRNSLPGGGVFPYYQKALKLTAQRKSRGVWLLPSWAYPNSVKPPLSYHSDRTRWRKMRAGALLRMVGRGQEFILDMEYYPEAIAWVRSLFRVAASPEPSIRSSSQQAKNRSSRIRSKRHAMLRS